MYKVIAENQMEEFNWLTYNEDPYITVKSWTLTEFIKEFGSFTLSIKYYSVTGGGEPAYIFEKGKTIVFNIPELNIAEMVIFRDNLSVELKKSGHYVLHSDLPENYLQKKQELQDAMLRKKDIAACRRRREQEVLIDYSEDDLSLRADMQ